MGEGAKFRVSSLWASRNPLRIVGNLFLAWLLAVIFLVAILLPVYPTTKLGWLGVVGFGPPGLLTFCLGYEKLEHKPILWRVTAAMLWVVASVAVVVFIHHCATASK